MYELFLQVHLVLAFVALLALIKHLLPTKSSSLIFPAISLSLWGLNALLRTLRIAYLEMASVKNHDRRRLVKSRFGSRRMSGRRLMRKAADDREGSIGTHSGAAGKLKTLDEEV